MTRTTHLILQFAVTMLHPVVALFPVEVIHPVWRPMVSALLSTLLGFLQLLLADKANAVNPDGTPASVAYLPYEKTNNHDHNDREPV